MKYKYKIIILFFRFIITASGYLYSQTAEIISSENIDNNFQFDYVKVPKIIFNPFPVKKVSLVQPVDSLNVVKNIINLNFGYKQLVVTLSTDWGTINIVRAV